ncbi:hypothetical protein SDC9_15013 [bioreactor metagenome]|uniref:HTH cro/C1-type domain-containing protein n=1 Tax=bioreactor metagenome TaxID=1076179 RepID=A0A644TQK0_9ZZZZ
MKFANRLKELRQAHNVSQKYLAELLGISPRALRFYESNDREPNIAGLNLLADYFCVSLDYLVGRSDDPMSFDFLLASAKFLSSQESTFNKQILKTIEDIQSQQKPEECLFEHVTALRKVTASSEFFKQVRLLDEDRLDTEDKQLLEQFKNCDENILEMVNDLKKQNLDKMHERFERYKEIFERIDNQAEKK